MTVTTSPLSDLSTNLSLQPAREAVDVRPILVRSATNAWERTEQLRADLYALIEQHCRAGGFEALVLQSNHYVHPAWVTFESWLPTEKPGVTARAAATITITTRPYQRFEAVYKVSWTKHGQNGAIDQLYQFGEGEVERLLMFLAAAPAHSFTGWAVRRMLAPVQLRQKWYQLWKPRNKVPLVRRDRWLIASVGAVLGGAMLLISGFTELTAGDSSVLASLTDTSIPIDTNPGAIEESSENAVLPPPEGLPAARTSRLDDSDQRLDNGQLYELQMIPLRAGEPAVITMRSNDFDTLLTLGQFQNGSFVALETNDDAGDDGTNSRLEFVPTATGEYGVVFSSYEAGKTGTYTFTLP